MSPALPRGCIFSKNENGKKTRMCAEASGLAVNEGSEFETTHLIVEDFLPPSTQKASPVQPVFKAVKT